VFIGPCDGLTAGREASSEAGRFEWWTTRSNVLRSLDTGLSTPCGAPTPRHSESDVPLRRRCDMFDVQEAAPSVGRYGQHRSHGASLAARCGLHAGARYGRGSDRIDRQVPSPDNDATAGVKSMLVPVAVIRTTNTSRSAIRSLPPALSSSRRRSTGGRGRATWGTK
jgi:hypothetical protein